MSDHTIIDSTVASDPWTWWRRQMPIVKNWAYFDHAAVSPLPRPTQERIASFAKTAAEVGTTAWPDWSKGVERFREGVACWIGAEPTEIAMIPNTSHGVNLVAEGFPWQAGDNVVTFAGEFPSNRLPWENQRSKGVEVRTVACPQGRVSLDAIDEQIDSKTKIVAISWIGYSTGFRIDLDKIVQLAHDRGALVFLDAIQGMGMYPLDVRETPVDFLAADGHKWMLGPEGAGVAYIKQEHIERLRCGHVGWHSIRNSHDFKNAKLDLRPEASRFEAGSANMVGLLALAESIRMFWQIEAAHGRNAISERVLSLAEQASGAVSSAGGNVLTQWEGINRSSILVIDVPGIPAARVRTLGLERGVVLSVRGGGVRASIHAYNDDEDIARLAEVIRDAASTSQSQ